MESILSHRKYTTLYLDREHPQGPVVYKVLNDEYPTPKHLARFYNEYAISQEITSSGIRRCLAQTRYKNRYALLLEHIDGPELSALRVKDRRSLCTALQVACQIVDALDQLHQARIIHRDLKPENILLRQRTPEDPTQCPWEVFLIDLGLATRLDLKNEHFGDPHLLEGTLRYISPEQSGRMNRTVDYRSDYYSFGATLYTILAGRPPFESIDPMELVYSHLVRVPPPLHEINPAVPQVVSSIVARLLHKSPEERYQSATGLRKDLQQCLQQLEESGDITPFPLGELDHSGRFALAEKLYGRAQEKQVLLDAFAGMGQTGSRMICITGHSGTGKSALVKELFQTITAHKGQFVRGKFDQLQRNTPFLGHTQAFGELLRALMTAHESHLNAWKTSLQERLGQLTGALLPVIPNIELLLGRQPPPPPLEGAASQHRLFYAMRQFVQVLSPQEHPLVIFLDDLQWADLASLDLLTSLLTDPERGHFLIIAAYRDNEVHPGHPLATALEEMQQKGIMLQNLHLSTLHPHDITSMLEDALHTQSKEIDALAALVHRKTSGNAFFVHSFLQLLAERGLLLYEHSSHRWRWEHAQIESLQVTDNVADLLVDKIKQMPPAIQAVMRYAACLGNRFPLELLAALCQEQPAAMAHALEPAMAAGLLRPIDEGYAMVDAAAELEISMSVEYRFVHDRVQQAAASLLTPEKRQKTHWKIGQLLLSKSHQSLASVGQQSEDLPPEQLFEILYHLNMAPGLAQDDKERRTLATLNLQGGRLATQAGAFAQAMACCEIGLELCLQASPTLAWQQEYQLTLALHLTLAEAAGLAMKYERVREIAQQVLSHAHTGIDKARAYDALAMVDMAREDLSGAIKLGLKALAELKVQFPTKPILPHVIFSLLRTQRVLKGRVDELEQLPTLKDPTLLAALSLIERLMPAAFRSGSLYFPLFVFELVRLSALHGNSRYAVFGYASFAIAQCAVLKKYDVGYRFARMACRLGEIYPDIGHLFIFNTFVRHWREPLAEIPAHMAREYRVSLEAGNMYQATWLAAYRIFFLFLCGSELTLIDKECQHLSEALAWDEGTTSVRLMLTQCVANLTQPCATPYRLEGEFYDEAYVRRRYDKQNDTTEIGQFHILNMLLALLFGTPQKALPHAEEVVKYIEGLNPMPFFPLMHLMCALIQLDTYRRQPTIRRLWKAHRHVKAIVRLAQEGPNYTHLAALAKAEWYWAKNKPLQAAAHFAEGLQLANRSKAPLYQRGLLLQRAAQFHESQGHEELAQAFWKHTFQCYREWGATALLAHWKQQPQSLASLTTIEFTTSSNPSLQSSSSTSSTNLDLQSLWKASAALTAEIVKDRLLERLMHIMVENAGAQRGALLLSHQDTLQLAATFDGTNVSIANTEKTENSAQSSAQTSAQSSAQTSAQSSAKSSATGPADHSAETLSSHIACAPIVQYVMRTQKPLVLEDAQLDERFANIPHIRQHQVRSVLCAPIVHQGRQSAVVYLENNVIAGAFTPQRLEIITLLSAQAGTALENATLYSALEEKVTERTKELKETMAKLVQSEKMASLGTLVAGVAHELNNPANFAYNGAKNLRRRIDGLEETLLGDEPDQESKEMLQSLLEPLYSNIESIEEGAQRIQEIVLGLRTFSRLDEGTYKRIHLTENIESTLTLVHANYKDQIEFIKDWQDAPDIYCHPAQLNQLLMNVIVNGCQAVLAHKETQKTDADFVGQLRLCTRREDDYIAILIEDNGCGMPPEVQARMFEPFFTTKSVGKGAGLGLSIAFGIIEKHKGRIEVTSAPEEGTTIALYLPLQSSDSAQGELL